MEKSQEIEYIMRKKNPMRMEIARCVRFFLDNGKKDEETILELGKLWGEENIKKMVEESKAQGNRNFSSFREPLNSDKYK